MVVSLQLSHLEVIGYATRLDDDMLPTIVAPIFRRRADPEQVVLPPFSLRRGLVFTGSTCSANELDALEAVEQVTRLDEPIQARSGFELWVDVERRPIYERADVAERKLRRIAFDAIDQAKDALARGDLDGASRHAGIALAADDRRIEPPALLAAVRRKQGNAGSGLMCKVAQGRIEAARFEALVQVYLDLSTTRSRDAALCAVRGRLDKPEKIGPATEAARRQ
jgi:hypothetical protein